MSGYEEMRERFVQLCLNVPERLAAERSTNARDEFDCFCAEKRVTHVAVENKAFLFTTCRLAMETPVNGYRWIGSFLVSIHSSTKAISIEGDEERHGPTHHAYHPHVLIIEGNEGTPCFGDTGRVKLNEWFADGKMAHVAFYVLNFLCIARGTSDYMPVTNWSELTPEEATEWKKLL